MPDTLTTPPSSPTDDALAVLVSITDAQLTPGRATGALEALRQRHPDCRFDLVWDVQDFDGSVHYDLLVRRGGRSLSLSVSPAVDDLPWPLRGAQRVGDKVLLSVDGQRLEIGEAVRFLDLLDVPGGDEPAALAERLVDICLVRSLVADRVARLTPADTDRAVAEHRTRLGVGEDAELAAWCRVRGLGPEDFRDCAAAYNVLVGLHAHGVDGVPLATWKAQRRERAAITWHWALGAPRVGSS